MPDLSQSCHNSKDLSYKYEYPWIEWVSVQARVMKNHQRLYACYVRHEGMWDSLDISWLDADNSGDDSDVVFHSFLHNML